MTEEEVQQKAALKAKSIIEVELASLHEQVGSVITSPLERAMNEAN